MAFAVDERTFNVNSMSIDELDASKVKFIVFSTNFVLAP